VQSDTLPIDQTSNSYQAGEAQKVRLQVTATLTDEEQVITFRALVDTAFQDKERAEVIVKVFDETASQSKPTEQLYLDHQIDKSKPDYVEFQLSQRVMAPGEQRFSGFVNDESSVPTITLDLNGQEIRCNDSTAGNAQWSRHD
jgi:hypothetical protein